MYVSGIHDKLHIIKHEDGTIFLSKLPQIYERLCLHMNEKNIVYSTSFKMGAGIFLKTSSLKILKAQRAEVLVANTTSCHAKMLPRLFICQ